MEHTATPWVCHSGMVWKLDKSWPGTHDIPIAKMDRDTSSTQPTERDANAEFIVRACNAHDELVEAATLVLVDLQHGQIHIANQLKLSQAIAKAEANDTTRS